MSEFELKIQQGAITTNLDNLKKELTEIADKYKGVVVSEHMIPEAKKDLASLRALAKEVDDRRKAVKKEWEKPYKDFEAEVKSALEIINAPIEEIDRQLKEFEAQRKAEKEQHVRELYEENIGEYADYAPFSEIFDDKWLNKSTEDSSIVSDISMVKTKVMADLDAIKALNSEFESEVIAEYRKSRQLSFAIKRNSDLVSAKQLAEKKADEEAQAKIEAERKAREEAERKATEAEKRAEEAEQEEKPVLPFGDYAVFTVRVQDEEQYEQVKQFCEFSEIQYAVVR